MNQLLTDYVAGRVIELIIRYMNEPAKELIII
jgi:hypothetical protein